MRKPLAQRSSSATAHRSAPGRFDAWMQPSARRARHNAMTALCPSDREAAHLHDDKNNRSDGRAQSPSRSSTLNRRHRNVLSRHSGRNVRLGRDADGRECSVEEQAARSESSLSRLFDDTRAINGDRTPKSVARRRRIHNRLGEALLVLDRAFCAAACAAATMKSLTLRPSNSAARFTTASVFGATRASIRAVRLTSWRMSLSSRKMYGEAPHISRCVTARSGRGGRGRRRLSSVIGDLGRRR